MHRTSKTKLRGYIFKQHDIENQDKDTGFTEIRTGQPLAAGFLAASLTTITSMFAGTILGGLGAIAAFNLLLPIRQSWITIIGVVIVIVVWQVSALMQTLIQALINTGLVILLIALALFAMQIPGWLEASSYIGVSLFLFLALGCLVFCCLVSGFAAILSRCLFNGVLRKGLVFFYSALVVLAAILSAYHYSFFVYNPIQTPTPLFDYLTVKSVRYIAFYGGVLLGSISHIVGTTISYRRRMDQQQFIFLNDWAIAAAAWKGTSFRDLDLSGINFANSILANSNLRARKLYRVNFQGVVGLDKAQVDNRYLDLKNPNVQQLLVNGSSSTSAFSQLCLRGAYLHGATLRNTDFTDTELTGADLSNADLQNSIFTRADVTDINFTDARLTGICIQDWNVNSQTLFTNVQCDYVYRRLDAEGRPSDRYPADRNFEPREFESLYQEVGNVVELVFKEGINWRAFAFTLQKLQLDDDGLDLQLKGIEKRGDLWVVKVTHNEHLSTHEVEQRLTYAYDELRQQLAAKEQQINHLLGIASTQAEALKEFSKRSFGNSFFITGSTITNLAGSGQIDYNEAAGQVRTLLTHSSDQQQLLTIAHDLLARLQRHNLATTPEQQSEFIQQMILAEAQKDEVFKRFLQQQGQQLLAALPPNAISTAIQAAIAHLSA